MKILEFYKKLAFWPKIFFEASIFTVCFIGLIIWNLIQN